MTVTISHCVPTPNLSKIVAATGRRSAQDTAATSFAPSRAMPPFSATDPTEKPVMFWRKSTGTPRWLQSSTKWAPFWDAFESRTPPFASTPTRRPSTRPKPQTSVGP